MRSPPIRAPRGDGRLPGPEQHVLADASFDARLAGPGPQVTADISRDRRAPGTHQHVTGDRAGHGDLAPGGHQVAVDSTVDPHGPSGGDQVALDCLGGWDGHLLAGPHLPAELVLLGGGRGRQGHQRNGKEHDSPSSRLTLSSGDIGPYRLPRSRSPMTCSVGIIRISGAWWQVRGLTPRGTNEQSPVGRVPRRKRCDAIEEATACSFSD